MPSVVIDLVHCIAQFIIPVHVCVQSNHLHLMLLHVITFGVIISQ